MNCDNQWVGWAELDAKSQATTEMVDAVALAQVVVKNELLGAKG